MAQSGIGIVRLVLMGEAFRRGDVTAVIIAAPNYAAGMTKTCPGRIEFGSSMIPLLAS